MGVLKKLDEWIGYTPPDEVIQSKKHMTLYKIVSDRRWWFFALAWGIIFLLPSLIKWWMQVFR